VCLCTEGGVLNDDANCGTCGTACGHGQTCQGGSACALREH
jgi:hypothetical protein